MYSEIKKNIKSLIPPLVIDYFYDFNNPYGFSGEYKNWEIAQGFSLGYDSDIILNKTKNALLKVKNGEAVFERDSFLFDKIQYSWPLLASLLYVASVNNNRLNLIDFGGSLGSSYYQNRNFLKSLDEITWNIIEQSGFVACGQENFTDEHLRFYSEIGECLKENPSTLVLFSGALQYLSEPYNVLDQLFEKKIKFVLLDRLVINNQRDLITVQKVDPIIYDASYPLWIFKEKNIINYFIKNDYELVVDFNSLIDDDFKVKKTNISGCHKGYLFKLKD